MQNELHVVNFLRNGGSLIQLQEAPYNLIVREMGDWVLLKYSQGISDGHNPIVNECRGIILSRKNGWKPVCYPFNRFYNFQQEEYCASLSGNLRVYQKVDGSLCKVWYNHDNREWMLSSNTCIDAHQVSIGSWNFYTLFVKALSTYGLTWDTFTWELDIDRTYMYELATQDNQVVIHYDGYNIFYLGERDNSTYQEEYHPDSRIDNVKVYNFNSLAEIISSADELPDDEEGYVVCDEHYNRVKVKNPTYFMLHYAVNNNHPDLVELVIKKDEDEFLGYFPQFKAEVDKIKEDIQHMGNIATFQRDILARWYHLPRGSYAAKVKAGGVPVWCQSFVFKCYENHSLTWDEFTADWDFHKWANILERAREKGDI